METSKVEFLAQKQNRVAQHRLNDRMTQIDRDFTLSKLATRIFIKQLRLVGDELIFQRPNGSSSHSSRYVEVKQFVYYNH